MVLDYTFTKVSRYDATGRTEAAIEVFDAITGDVISFCRRNPFESRANWVARAMERANDTVALAA